MAASLHNDWLQHEVDRHYLKFSQKRNVNMFIGTWNVNGKEPKERIKSWLFDSETNFKAEIYVCGFQEIVDLNATNLWIENTANIAWEKLIGESLGSDYIQICSRHLVGILLCIYVNKSLRPFIKRIMSSTVGVGLFGTAGNKGGVGIRMQLFDSDICFICTHLAAHKNNVQGRNQDYVKIIENLKFSNENNNENNNNETQLFSILSDHDMIFWLGDLNYRLNFDNLEYVFSKVRAKDWRHLLSLDQLNIERTKQRTFIGFMESEITFDPTYKFQPGTSIYEQRPDRKRRFPAWCDRVLWRTGMKKTTTISDVKCIKYWISMEQKMSDHKPVYTHIKYKANIFDKNAMKQMRDEIIANKDKSDNNQLPQIEIEPEITFPLIRFGNLEIKKHMIHNTGQVSVAYRFTNIENKKCLPKWLNISPANGILKPKEKLGITFQIRITSESIKYICKNGYKLEETILLRIENSFDQNTQVPMKFIVITGKYLVSCFGNKIENLVKYKKPIRYIEDIYDINIDQKQIQKQIIKYDENHGQGDIDINEYLTSIETTLSIPKELWRLIDHLYKYGMDCKAIFVERGINTEISEIRECLDTGVQFTRYDMHSVGEALIRFLESLQDPIFPYSLCQSFNINDPNIDITQWCKQALMKLPLAHYNSFIYIISFLREILNYKQKNMLTAEKLAYQFSSALMQKTIKDVNQLAKFKPFKILRHFLSADLFL